MTGGNQFQSPLAADAQAIAAAADALAQGHLVAFPTETVYGLGADALSTKAVGRVFFVKGRPPDHPLIVHVASSQAAEGLAREWPESAQILARAFWPGPLTLVVRRSPRVPDSVTGGQDTVGLRVPAHPVALALLQAFARVGSGAVAAPSANVFGALSPTRALDVTQGLKTRLGPEDLVLDGGPCSVGLESTIVDCTVSPVRILRPGGVPRQAIARLLALAPEDSVAERESRPRVSGSHESHYAPRTPLLVLDHEALWARVHAELARNPQIKLYAWVFRLLPEHGSLLSQGLAPRDPQAYGQALYARLHDWDSKGFDALFLESPPNEPEWEAVRDRLRRAAYGGDTRLSPNAM